LCASATHPLTQAASVTLNELQQQIELSVQDSSERGDDRHMFGGERVFFLAGFTAKKQALLMGLGFGWMPRYLIETELASGTLKEVPYVGGARYRFTPALVHRRDQPLGRAGQELSRLLCG
jgi:DNA-binding transcriptional LysR family regulator